MLNFRLYPGLFIKVLNDYDTVYPVENLKAGRILQIMGIQSSGVNYDVYFVGVNGSYPLYYLNLEPIYADTVEYLDFLKGTNEKA